MAIFNRGQDTRCIKFERNDKCHVFKYSEGNILNYNYIYIYTIIKNVYSPFNDRIIFFVFSNETKIKQTSMIIIFKIKINKLK